MVEWKGSKYTIHIQKPKNKINAKILQVHYMILDTFYFLKILHMTKLK